jgi:hypothetical protein
MNDWNIWLTRWAEAGLVDADTATRIRSYEQRHASSSKLRWPVLVASAFGALMLGGGVLLFVAAHWDALSPTVRFLLVLTLVGGFHVAGAFFGERSPGLSSALHAVGTVALGAGIGLAGQIFNLDEHWPSGVLLWAVGAGAAWLVLRQAPQAALLATLVPAWLLAEWSDVLRATGDARAIRVSAAGVFLLALTYFTLVREPRTEGWQRALFWLGGVTVLPAAILLAAAAERGWWRGDSLLLQKPALAVIGWGAALGLPLALAVAVRRLDAWPHAVAAVWTLGTLVVEQALGDVAVFVWWAIGAVGLVAWGVREGRGERVNMGAAVFAATVVAFYFSQVMDKLGRSASLVGFGLLFLAGGWALERVRRRLVEQARGAA